MHHDILALLDAHLALLCEARNQLAASRRVAPGERRAAVLHTIDVSERYAAQARTLLTGPGPVPPAIGATTGVDQPARVMLAVSVAE